MSSYFGINSDSSSSFFNNYFGTTSSTNSASNSLSLGDYALIKSGSYKKLLNKYYAENGTSSNSNTISKTAAADSTKQLLSVKEGASAVKNDASQLSSLDLENTNVETLLKKAKNFVGDYNSLVENMDNVESVSILQNALWMTNQTKANSVSLNKIGISVDSKNTLKIDEDKFKAASSADLAAVFSGKNSTVSQISTRASQLFTLAGTQAIINSKNGSYTSSGSYAISTSQLYNSLL